MSYGLTENEIDVEPSRGENAENPSRMTIVSPGDGIVELLAARPGEAAKPWAVIMVIDEANQRNANENGFRIPNENVERRGFTGQ